MPERTDHENILLLTEAFGSFAKQFGDFKIEIKSDIKELKDNYADRLSRAEQELVNLDKVKIAKEEQDFINKDHLDRIELLEKWRWYLVGISAVSTPVLVWLAYQLLNHLLKG